VCAIIYRISRSLIAVLVLGACGIALQVVLLLGQSRFFSSSDLPDPIPDESRRIIHPDGYSIVCPRGWTSRIVDLPDEVDDAIEMRSREYSRGRVYGSSFSVTGSVASTLDPQAAALKVANGREIHVEMVHKKGAFPDEPSTTRFRLQLDSFPGEIVIHCATNFDSLPPSFLPYIASIRLEPNR
jgi:hypothetical protein